MNEYTTTAGSEESTRSEVLQQLDRIFPSKEFAAAPVLTRFLRYIVEQTLDGKADQLKEYTVGTEVFGRSSSFDPRTDTIVRVQARRLRARLNEYYAAEGKADPIRICVDKGGYAARFERRQPETLAPASHSASSDSRSATVRENSPGWLPVPHTRLIGREREIAEITAALRTDQGRLLTLTGPGGTGKTRLALHVASEVASLFPGGVHFVPLASISDPGLVLPSIAQALDVWHTKDGSLIDALTEHLHFRLSAPALLVIDNFEHVLPAAATVARLLEASRFVHVLATSRAVLHVYGEREYPVLPLPPPSLDGDAEFEGIIANPAVRLFAERAGAVCPGFALTDSNASAVAQLCARLDGLPLAIELAAARTRILSPSAMLSRMDKPLDWLTAGPHGLPERQQTLRRALEWSYELLSVPEQKLFRRLGAFAGGCTEESVEAVCNTRLDLGMPVLDGLYSLVEKSLITTTGESDEVRFEMLQTIREYALEQLKASGEEPASRHAHAAYYLVIAEEGKDHPGSARTENWLQRCDREHNNLRAAHDWLVATGKSEWALRLATALYFFWERREHLVEGRERLLASIEMHAGQPPNAILAAAVGRVGALAVGEGDLDTARREHLRSLELFRVLGHEHGYASQLGSLGTVSHLIGDLEGARHWFEQCVAAFEKLAKDLEVTLARFNLANVLNALGERDRARSLLHHGLDAFARLGQAPSIAWTLNRLGDVARDNGDRAEARSFYIKGLDLFRRLNDHWGVGRSLLDIGYLELTEANLDVAEESFNGGASAFAQLGHKRGIVKAIEAFATLSARRGDHRRALTLAGAAAALRQRVGALPRPAEKMALDRSLAPTWQACDPAEAESAWRDGWKLPPHEALNLTH